MGRGGAGALFGSKNLKAIAVRGTGGVQVNEIGSFYEKVVEHTSGNLLTEDNLWAQKHGTALLVDVTNEMGIHPTRNFTKGVSNGRQNLNSDAIDDVKIGMKVQSTFRKIQADGHTGAIYYGYKFKPI